MSSTVQAPIPGVQRRPIPWFAVAVASALALIAAIVVVLDGGTDSAVDRGTTGRSVAGAQVPIACGPDYGSLLAVMGYSMTPDATERIAPVLSEKTRSGLQDTTVALAAANAVPQDPDPITLALALGRLTPAESAAIVAELPTATREAVANAALDAGLVGAVCR